MEGDFASFRDLVFDLGWKINKDGSLSNINNDNELLNCSEFYKRFRHEAQRVGLDENLIDYLTLDNLGNPIMPNYMNLVESKLESIAQAIFNSNITRQKLPGWHAAQVTQVGHGMKVLDSNGKLRELKYHPEVIKGRDKRLTIKINNNEYEKTDEFREFYERSHEANRNGEYWRGDKNAIKEGIVGRLADVFRTQLHAASSSAGYADGSLSADNRAGTRYTIRKNVSGKLFHDIFEIARNYLPNGELVDIHDSYDDCVCYLSEDGTSGFAIEQETGNLVSVFNLGLRKGFLSSIKDYIRKEGATHLDAYASNKQDLREIYEKTLGAKVVSTMDYNMEYDHDNIAKNHGNPEVVFMVFGDDIDGRNVEERHFGKDEYDAAAEYAQSFNIEQTAYAEVMIPRWSNLIPKDYPIELLEKEGLDIQIAYRIPTEGKQSVSVVKVVGFLDDVYGSTIMLPDEWVTQTGSDFDIDTVLLSKNTILCMRRLGACY